ncbi:MAG: hypothetical protein ACEPO8_06435 [Rhodothermaceae bacterium]
MIRKTNSHKKKDETTFELNAIVENKSPLDVKGVNINLQVDEILDYIKESRSSKY